MNWRTYAVLVIGEREVAVMSNAKTVIKKKITIMNTYEIVKEFIGNDGNVNDFVVLDFYPKNYDDALAIAQKQDVCDDEQISIWLSDDKGNVLDSWLIK